MKTFQKIATGIIAFFTFIPGMVKFTDPFKSIFKSQIEVSEMPFPELALIMGQLGEISVGLLLIALLFFSNKVPKQYLGKLFILANVAVIGIMSVAVSVHLNPNVGADLLPFGSKAPILPSILILLAGVNLYMQSKKDNMEVKETKKGSSKKLNAIYGITAGIFVIVFLVFVFKSHKAPENNTSAQIEKTNTMRNIEDNNLKEKLDARKEAFTEMADANTIKVYGEGIADIENSDILSQAKQLGDNAPDFSLVNALGETVSLNNYLKQGPVVLTWYRGGWCPYCNLTLQALQNELPNFKAAGANLIALTPELPDKSLSTTEKHDLKFEVLSDINSKVAKEYGLVFKLTDDVATIYNNNFDLEAYNGNKSDELPLAATYIINQQGEIVYAFIDADYRNRAEPSEITAQLLELTK